MQNRKCRCFRRDGRFFPQPGNRFFPRFSPALSCRYTEWREDAPRHRATALRRISCWSTFSGISMPCLTGLLPYRLPEALSGAGEGIRTPDPLITNQMLYRLSYASTWIPCALANTRRPLNVSRRSGQSKKVPQSERRVQGAAQTGPFSASFYPAFGPG